LATHHRLEEARSAVEQFYDRWHNDEATRDAITRHFHEGHNNQAKEVDKSTCELYRELFTKYGWNLYVGFMLHAI
jgi:hypothetical protein